MKTQNMKAHTMNTHTQNWKSRLFLIPAAIAVCAFTIQGIRAQDASVPAGDKISVNLSDPSRPATIKASLLNGSITVKGYDGKEVVAEARVRSGDSRRGPRGWRSDSDDRRPGSDDSSSAPTPGMKRLSLAATGLAVEEDANVVRVSTDSVNRTIDLVISVPRQSSVILRTVNDGNLTVTDITGDIDVNDTNGSVTLEHISGSVVAHALNGKVRATFDHVGQKSMAFSSLNGAIDVTFPPDLKANLLIKSDRGDVYSDFDVQLATGAPQQVVEDGRKSGEGYRVRIDKTIHATIGGGGPEIQFTNMEGNIYIRKTGASKSEE